MLFRNVSGGSLWLPTLDRNVPDGETFEMTGDAAKGLTGNPDVERVTDKPSKNDKES